MLEPLPTGAWSFLAITAAIATNTLSFGQVHVPVRVHPVTGMYMPCHGRSTGWQMLRIILHEHACHSLKG